MIDIFAQVCGERGVGISKSSLKTLIQDLLLVTHIVLIQLKTAIIINEYFFNIFCSCLRMCQKGTHLKPAPLTMLLMTAGKW